MSSQLKAFIIDDMKSARLAISQLLDSLDIKWDEFESPKEALKQVDQLNPDLIFLDYLMPEMDGEEFMIGYSEKNLFEGRTVILVSGKEFEPDELFSVQSLGINHVVKKPLTTEDIKKIIAEKS